MPTAARRTMLELSRSPGDPVRVAPRQGGCALQLSGSSHPAPPFRGFRRAPDPGRVFVGFAILAVGVLHLVEAFDVLNAGRAVDHWWPVVLGALIVTGVGALLLPASTHALNGDSRSYVWPVAAVAVGAAILARRTGPRAPARAPGTVGAVSDDATVTATASFGGSELRSTSQQFRHGSVTAVFGRVTHDLRGARLDPAGATITATAVFDGIDVEHRKEPRRTARMLAPCGACLHASPCSRSWPASQPPRRPQPHPRGRARSARAPGRGRAR